MKILVSALFIVVSTVETFSQAKADTWVNDEHGATVRGDLAHKEIALLFIGDEHGQGTDAILETLDRYNIPGSFFLSGKFYANKDFQPVIRRLLDKGHYIGLHPNQVFRYTSENNRDSLIVDFESFRKDIENNFKQLSHYGIKRGDALHFLPSCHCYNAQVVEWTKSLGFHMIFSSPGTAATADYLNTKITSNEDGATILSSLIEFEKNNHHGLNGFLLPVHLGSKQNEGEAFHEYLPRLIEMLDHRGYNFVEVHELLD